VQAAEAKARRKEEKKNLRAQQKLAPASEANERAGGGDDGGSDGQGDNDNAEDGDGHFDGVATFGGPTKGPPSKSMSMSGAGIPLVAASAGAKDGDGAPLLINSDLPHLAAVLDKADVVIEVLDARDPLAHRSSALEARVKSKEGQKLLLVLNKIGACALISLIQCYVMTDRTARRHMSSRIDRRMGCSVAFRAPDAALPRRIVLSPTCRHVRTEKGKRKEQGAIRRCMGLWCSISVVEVLGPGEDGRRALVRRRRRPCECTPQFFLFPLSLMLASYSPERARS